MRNGLIGLAGTMLLASSVATNGCGNGSSGGQATAGTGGSAGTGTGGSAKGGGTAGGSTAGGSTAGGVPGSGGQQSNTGGSSSGSGGFTGSCPNVTPCGGDLVGTWTVTSSCLDVSGQLDVSLIGMSCPSLPVTGSLQVGGSWTAAADGSYVDSTVTTGSETFTLAPECLVISSTPTTCNGAASVIQALGYSSVVCNEKTGGGCDCSATVEQSGGMGLVSYLAAPNGWYTVAGSTLTTDVVPYSYCVSGNTLTLTPGATMPEVSGTIVLQNGEPTGEGGAPGAGGASQGGSSSGGTGNGGQPGSGGAGQGGSSSGGSNAGGTNSGGATSGGAHTGPCDIYEAANHPCVAAHSTVRALYGSYDGKLYQVRRSDDTTLDISTLSPGGYADSAPQDTFCSGTTCVLTVVYDQSGMGNDMWYQGSDVVPGSPSSSPARATSESLTVGGHKVYSLYIQPGNCYWRDGSQTGMALGDAPEGMYMVTSGTHANGGCCFDYGNSETSRTADGAGTMDSINFSTTSAWGTGAGSGPWIMADLEWGLFSMGSSGMNPNDPSQTSDYVTAILKNNGTTEFALRGGNATTGPLGTYYKGTLPGGWTPMKKQGAITLGCGGDCCKPDGGANLSAGTFYEGAIVTGYPDDETEDAIQENIVEAGYGQ